MQARMPALPGFCLERYMIENEKLNGLIADVREHLIYYTELGVELLDVNLAKGDEPLVGVTNKAADAVDEAAIPRDLPDVGMVGGDEAAKPSVKRPSKLSG